MFGMGFDVNGALIGMLQDGAAKVKTKSVTENGVYTAANEPVGQGEDKYDGYSVFTVNVTDDSMQELQEWLFSIIYGHPYDPEHPDPQEPLPSEEDVVDYVEDAEPTPPDPVTGSQWKYSLQILRFVGNYKTYENPSEVLEGSNFSDQLSVLCSEAGCEIRMDSGYPRWGDNIKNGAEEGQSDKSSEYKTAWFIYSVHIIAKYKADAQSDWELKYDVSGLVGNIWTNEPYGNPDVYSTPYTKVDKLQYDAGSQLLLEIIP